MLKANEKPLGVLNRRVCVYTFIKITIVLFGKKIENFLSQRIRYRICEHETVDHLENVFVIDLI